MDYRVNLLWKVVAELEPEGVASLQSVNGALFNKVGGRSFVRNLGGDFQTSLAPVVLRPTDIFYKAIRELQDSYSIEGKRFPLVFDLHALGPTRVNFAFHLYENQICVTCEIAEADIEKETDFGQLQDLKVHKKLHGFLSGLLGILRTGNRKAKVFGGNLKIYPAIRIVSFTSDQEDWRESLVGLVTRHPGANLIVDGVLKKNFHHQLDDETLLLLDKQGVAAYVPNNCAAARAKGNFQRFGNAASMVEYAAIVARLLRSKQWLPLDVREGVRNPRDAVPNSVSAKHLWELTVSEFSLKKDVDSWEIAKIEPKAPRILLLTVTNVETMAVHNAFFELTQTKAVPVEVSGFIYQKLGRVGKYDIFHAISGMGSGGLAGSQESVRLSIVAIAPVAVLMVGIAFGVDKKKQKIGEILISRQVQTYELQRLNENGTIELRGEKVTASPNLLNWVSHAMALRAADEAKVTPGLILSGEKLIDNMDYRDSLVRNSSGAIGGEMEAAGLYVACQAAGVGWLVIKAICDWADGKKNKNKSENQMLAAKNAALFSTQILLLSGATSNPKVHL